MTYPFSSSSETTAAGKLIPAACSSAKATGWPSASRSRSSSRCCWASASVIDGIVAVQRDRDASAAGFRAYEPAGGRRAVFCRLEHIVPCAIQDWRWGAGGLAEAAGTEKPPSRCSHCVAQLGEAYVLLVRRRGGHRIVGGFCSVT